MTFDESHAEKVARILFPHDVPEMWRCTTQNCTACDSMAADWQQKINNVLNALKTLEN
jgi:hypothetical protein